jgi:hypothetical protein
MNFAAFERAQVAAFAYCEARHTGSIDCVRAVCFILRNRVKSGWGNPAGSWLAVMEGSAQVAAQEPETAIGNWQLVNDRLLQLIVRDVDDIYLGQEPYDDRVRQAVCGEGMAALYGVKVSSAKKDWKPCLYYSFVDRAASLRPWFVENIIRKPAEHARVAQIGGKMMLYR